MNDKNLDAAQWNILMNCQIIIEDLIGLVDDLHFNALIYKENSKVDFSEVPDFWKNLIQNFSDYVISLPLLIRQALLNHGLPVNNIIEYPASW